MILAFELPLDPAPDEARTWLAQELAKGAYRGSWLNSLFDWVLGRAASTAGDAASLVQLLVALVVVAVMVGLVVWLLRTRVTAGHPIGDVGDGEVALEVGVTAAQYRQRAADALATGDTDAATMAWFRAMTVDLKERTVLDGAPSRTAHEITGAASRRFPAETAALAEAARIFDTAAYGVTPAPRTSPESASSLRDLDARLQAATPSWEAR